ncbi:MAG: hypothetical protein V7K47_04505 [Nostoc sp.]
MLQTLVHELGEFAIIVAIISILNCSFLQKTIFAACSATSIAAVLVLANAPIVYR